MPLRTDLFNYSLPDRLIAQTPSHRRDQSKLMVVDRAAKTISHHVFADLPAFLRPDDRIFRNNASVLPARLHGKRLTGGAVECFLLRPDSDPRHWWCLLRPGKKLPVNTVFTSLDGSSFKGTVLAKNEDGAGLVAFEVKGNESIPDLARRLGEVPLPPYIQRQGIDAERSVDRERYETVYADRARTVAIAAPTAGLHFTPELLSQLSAKGLRFGDITLHVGLGTFKPIQTEFIEDHPIHHEIYELPESSQDLLFSNTGRRIAVGTTTVRTLEHFLSRHSASTGNTYIGEADIYLYPPRTFKGVDALITNFHQPQSTLLCLVTAFLSPGSTEGMTWLRDIYAEAIAREYRFFSYGDAMLII